MKLSKLFTKTRKEAPKDETAKNAQLLIRGGFIHKEMAGVYAYLPLGRRVLLKIENIIREEMNAIGGEEIILTALQNPELWKKTDRWEQDVWFKTQLNNGVEIGLGWTQEEQIVNLFSQHINSYKDLPRSAYQIQTKFRNEERAKNGILRGREFRMKDMYSFHSSEEDLLTFYDNSKNAYKKVFERMGLGDRTYLTYASGGEFSKYSHEFQTLTDAGEDIIYIHKDDYGKGTKMDPVRAAINKEIFTDETKKDLGIEGSFEEKKAVEVGNIFILGTRFSESLGLSFKNKNGEERPVVMGCYGIGSSRLMGTIVEVLSDERGIIWPKEVAPFRIHLVRIGDSDSAQKAANDLYSKLESADIEVLYDDREGVSVGVKFADVDLIGIPDVFIISDRAVAKEIVEWKDRKTGDTKDLSLEDFEQKISLIKHDT